MSYIGAQPTSVAFQTDQFSGNGSTVAFTMSVAPASTSSMLVVITGVTQNPTTYSIVGTTLTFSAAPPTGTGNISVRYLGIPASGVTTTAYRTITNFTATAGQTTFSVPSYTVGYIDVFRNGVRLVNNGADFVATNGTTIVLNNACTVGDSVVTESFYVSSVLNAIPATAGAVNSTYITDAAVTQAKLAAGVAGNGPAFSAYGSTNLAITQAVATKIVFDIETFDTNNNFASSRFTPTVAGYYQITAGVSTLTPSTTAPFYSYLSRNGAQIACSGYLYPMFAGVGTVTALLYFNGSTDYVEVFAYQGGVLAQIIFARADQTYFQGALVRAA